MSTPNGPSAGEQTSPSEAGLTPEEIAALGARIDAVDNGEMVAVSDREMAFLVDPNRSEARENLRVTGVVQNAPRADYDLRLVESPLQKYMREHPNWTAYELSALGLLGSPRR